MSYYFGRERIFDSGVDWEFQMVVDDDIKNTKTITFEEKEPIGDHHVFYLRYGMLYVKGVAREFLNDSFEYFGNGYFKLNGRLYYRGTPEASFPEGSAIKTWHYAQPPIYPPDSESRPRIPMCELPTYIYVLEASNGLRLEHEERYGSNFRTGVTCKSATGLSCGELQREGYLRGKSYYENY
ncbi:hypothetical protein [Burkholderia stagnalis]|uniref:hypothetical protein n=1 Tax=Burkholderia stagnalis TaxID=1503054 RepID=UPI000F8028C2|nr:hypothetical protein [Burkholderia stagnalis]